MCTVGETREGDLEAGRPGPRPFGDLWLFLFFLGAVFLLYRGALTLGFLSDDWYFLRRAALSTLPELFRVRVDPADPQSYHYVPVGEALFWLGYRVFGLDARPWHAVSFALHALNSFLAFRFAADVLGFARPAAAAAGLLFAVWFVHYEPLFLVGELYYPLACAFVLAGLLAFAGFLRRGGAARYAAYLCCVAAALLTIEGGMVTPGVAALLELGASKEPGGRRVTSAVRHQAPAAILFAGYVLLRSAGRTSMHEVPPIKVLGTFVYSMFGLLSLNVPALYEAYFAHKRAAAVALALLVVAFWVRLPHAVRLALAAFVVAFLPYDVFSGFETRYFYIPGAFGAAFLAGAAARVAGPRAPSLPLLAVALTALAGHGYRADRLLEWKRAAEIRDRTLAAACGPLSRLSIPPGPSLLVVDAPDSVGRPWGTSFPAFVFRNGLGEALAFCVGRPEVPFALEFVATDAAHTYEPKAQRRGVGEEELREAAAHRPILRFAASDPREVVFHAPQADAP